MTKDSMTTFPRSDTLNSWKEIARYLDRGVRTVQRWEHELQLPVRRPWGKKRSVVLALRTEIDAWIASCPAAVLNQSEDGAEPNHKDGVAA